MQNVVEFKPRLGREVPICIHWNLVGTKATTSVIGNFGFGYDEKCNEFSMRTIATVQLGFLKKRKK